VSGGVPLEDCLSGRIFSLLLSNSMFFYTHIVYTHNGYSNIEKKKCQEGSGYLGHPGFFHFVALRPYDKYIPLIIYLHLMHIIVRAQCNEVEEARVPPIALME
jgi:hypothetical protein